MNTNIQLKLNAQTYRDKVYACWIGKNIGGTMGGPFEGTKGTLDVQGFTTAPGEALPNDDLDLQLVWLHAVESIGARAVDCKTLGEPDPPALERIRHWQDQYADGSDPPAFGRLPQSVEAFQRRLDPHRGVGVYGARLSRSCRQVCH